MSLNLKYNELKKLLQFVYDSGKVIHKADFLEDMYCSNPVGVAFECFNNDGKKRKYFRIDTIYYNIEIPNNFEKELLNDKELTDEFKAWILLNNFEFLRGE